MPGERLQTKSFRKETASMDKNTAEEFQRENRPAWFLGLWSAMPVEARIVRICGDGSAGWHAEVDFSFGTAYVCLDDIFESKDCLIAAMYEDIQKKTAEIEAVIQTKDDLTADFFIGRIFQTYGRWSRNIRNRYFVGSAGNFDDVVFYSDIVSSVFNDAVIFVLFIELCHIPYG